MSAILEIRHVSKSFQGVTVLDDISLSVRRGEIRTILGENGAGKSTLMNVISGLYVPDSGDIFFDGRPVAIKSPKDAIELGIGMVHQHFMLVQAMDVIDNVILAVYARCGPFLDRDSVERDLLGFGAKYGLDIRPRARIDELSVGAQQRTEIVKALYRGAELLILDEPTAVLTSEETEGLFRMIRMIRDEGRSVIFISHKLKEVMSVSDRITVLRRGECVVTLEKEDTNQEELGRLMIGRDLLEKKVPKRRCAKDAVFEAKSLGLRRGNTRIAELSLRVSAGEILGIAGVDGNGQSELAFIASGMVAPEAGEIRINGECMKRCSAREFFLHGVAHIPEDRNRYGLVGGMGIEENFFLKSMERPPVSLWGGWLVDRDYIRRRSISWQAEYDIRASGPAQKAADLSGGNQQKVIIARELSNSPIFLVAMHPTRGLDIGAADFIHQELVRMRDRGCGILLISADLDEILLLSDRIGVMYEGALMGYEDGSRPDIGRIARLMVGRSEEEFRSEKKN